MPSSPSVSFKVAQAASKNLPNPATYAELKQLMLSRIGAAPIKSSGVATAVSFYAEHVPSMKLKDVFSELLGIDFSRPVHVESVEKGSKLQTFSKQFKSSSGLTPGIGNFYVKQGENPTTLGISLAGRHPVRVKTNSEMKALVSTAAPIKDAWSKADQQQADLAGGGGQQKRLAEGGKEKMLIERVSPQAYS